MHATTLLSGLMARMTGTPGQPDLPGEGLQTALALPAGAEAAFSGELMTLLQGLSPTMLQRLQGMVTGGMDLPQAARQLFADGGLGLAPGLDSRIPGNLSDLPVELASAGGRGPERGLASGLSPAQMAGLVRALPSSVDGGAAAAAIVPLSAQGMVATQSAVHPMSPQLAHSLLDMGVPQTVGGRGWQNAIGERVLWMAQGDQQFARLTLNPPHLGPLEVRVSVNQDQTSVLFLAHQAAVRDALDAALPRLRELFDQQSLSLLHAEVADPGSQQRDPRHATTHGASEDGAIRDHGVSDDVGDGPLSGAPLVTAQGLIDLFA